MREGYVWISGVKGRITLALAGTALITTAGVWSLSSGASALTIHLAPLPKPVHAITRHEPRRHRHSLLAGVASWYGEVLDGHTTASGEIFHKDKLTACHPTLPFGTLVRVINLRNRRSVVVRINDRGQLDPGRVIDLSSAAADRIGMLRAGLAPVRLEIINQRG